MSTQKIALQKIAAQLSESFKAHIKSLYYLIFKRKLYSTFLAYRFTDEKLKYAHILEAVNYLRVAGDNGKFIPMSYYEFGCHSGRTFASAINAAKFLNVDCSEFYAFDSFKGLPDTNEDDGYFKSGQFATSKENFLRIIKSRTTYTLNNLNVVEGFYEESLTADLRARLPNIGVCHIDVDLYSSTKTVLDFIKPLMVVGTVLLFDDWFCFPPGIARGERKALDEFLALNPEIKLEEWKSYSTFGKSFFVTQI